MSDTITHTLARLAEGMEAAPGFPQWDALRDELQALADRAASRPGDLTYVLLFGPTGCGKSKLANTVMGQVLTPVGYRRPTTTAPHVLVPRKDAARVVAGLPLLPYETIELECMQPERMVLIDAPDMDSLVEENQRLAETFLRLVDAVVVVVSPSKYADESIWRYLRRFARDDTACVIVLNKSDDPAVLSDFEQKLAQEHIAPAVIPIPYERSPDHALLAEGEGLAALRAHIAAWASSDQVRRRALQAGAGRCQRLLKRTLRPWLTHRREQAEDLQRTTAARTDAAAARLREGLPFELDRQTASRMYGRLLAQLERIDPLRVPRRILSYPFRLLRDVFVPRARGKAEPAEIQEVWDLNEEAFVTLVLDTCQELDDAHCRYAGRAPGAHDEAALRTEFQVFREEFRAWIAARAEHFASTLSRGQRARFYVAQILIFGSVLGLQLHTGGLLTLTELVANGVVSPFAARLMGMALSSDESRRFRDNARTEYLRRLDAMLARCTAPYLQAAGEACAGLAALDETAAALDAALVPLAGGRQ